jgi:hypothetical protein
VQDVAPDRERAPLAVCDLPCDTGHLVLRPRANRHCRTRPSQDKGNGPADPPARAGDQRDLPIETYQRSTPPWCHGILLYLVSPRAAQDEHRPPPAEASLSPPARTRSAGMPGCS